MELKSGLMQWNSEASICNGIKLKAYARELRSEHILWNQEASRRERRSKHEGTLEQSKVNGGARHWAQRSAKELRSK